MVDGNANQLEVFRRYVVYLTGTYIDYVWNIGAIG